MEGWDEIASKDVQAAFLRDVCSGMSEPHEWSDETKLFMRAMLTAFVKGWNARATDLPRELAKGDPLNPYRTSALESAYRWGWNGCRALMLAAAPTPCDHDLRAEYEGENGARAAICVKCHERVQTRPPTPPDGNAEWDRRDAERYRAIRACGSEWSGLRVFNSRGELDPQSLDAEADGLVAAMVASKGERDV